MLQKPKIIYLEKDKLYPKFGYAESSTGIAYVRDDLPLPVKNFVTKHELYHLQDEAKNVLWREIKANVYGAYYHPIGFIMCCFMSLAPYRIKFYIYRIRNKI